MKNKPTPWDLIAKYLADDLDYVERIRLQNWLDESEDNHDLLERSSSMWKFYYSSKKSEKINKTEEWNELMPKLLDADSQSIVDTTFRKRLFIGIAATVLILIGISIIPISGVDDEIVKIEPEINYTMVVAEDSIVQYYLPDSSLVILNINSSISYPSDFNQNNRSVKLSGEAFFEVESDINNPFTVQSRLTEVKVIGTSFNVKNDQEHEMEVVEVFEGEVEFKATDDDENIVRVKEGEVGIFTDSDQKIAMDKSSNKRPPWMEKFVDKSVEFLDDIKLKIKKL